MENPNLWIKAGVSSARSSEINQIEIDKSDFEVDLLEDIWGHPTKKCQKQLWLSSSAEFLGNSKPQATSSMFGFSWKRWYWLCPGIKHDQIEG